MNEGLLVPVDAKLKRAAGQIALVATNAKGWAEQTKIEAVLHLLPMRLGYELRASEFDLARVEEIGLVVGECLHNSRSALDNLLYGLACLRTNPPTDPRALQFPICATRDAFESKVVKKALEQLSAGVARKLERVQPFQRTGAAGDGLPVDDPILRLHVLNIADKHRVPIAVSLMPTEAEFTGVAEFETDAGADANVPPNVEIILPLRPNTTFFRWSTTHPLSVATGSIVIRGELRLVAGSDLLELDSTLMQFLRQVTLVRNYFASDFG